MSNIKIILNENKKILNFIKNYQSKNEYNNKFSDEYNKKFISEFSEFLLNNNFSKETINLFTN